MYPYSCVNLTKEQHPKFPDKCVVCGKTSSTFKKIYSTPYGHLGLFLWNTISVPAHEGCAKVLLAAHYLRFFGIVVPTVILIASFMHGFSFGLWVLSGLLLLFLLVYYHWQKIDSVPFLFIISDFSDRISYFFMDKDYAEEFAHLNNATVGGE